MYTFTPERYDIFIGLPSLPLDQLGINISLPEVEIEDWVSISVTKPIKRFNFSKGVNNEPFIEYIGDTSRTFSLSILQTSTQIEQIRNLIFLQEIGIIGLPFSIIDNGVDTNSNAQRQKSIYQVVIEDEPEESFSLDGATWVFNFFAIYGRTTYFTIPGIG